MIQRYFGEFPDEDLYDFSCIEDDEFRQLVSDYQIVALVNKQDEEWGILVIFGGDLLKARLGEFVTSHEPRMIVFALSWEAELERLVALTEACKGWHEMPEMKSRINPN